MKGQWGLIIALVFALLIAIFSVINVDPVSVNYLFGEAKWPLILVILGSVLMGALIVGSIGIVRVFRLQRSVQRLSRKIEQLETSETSFAGDPSTSLDNYDSLHEENSDDSFKN